MRQSHINPMMIELCGIPGGGKSTLARAYIERYGDEAGLAALEMYSKWPTMVHSFLYVLQHPLSFGWLLVFIARYHVRGLFWYSLHLGLRACAKYSIASRFQKRTVLVDEGLVHSLCVLGGTLLSQKEMDSWISRITLPDMVGLMRTGDFHRFHNEHALLHPRAQQGAGALNTWEEVVRAQVAIVADSLEAQGIPVWTIPSKEVSSASEMAEALHAHIFSASHE